MIPIVAAAKDRPEGGISLGRARPVCALTVRYTIRACINSDLSQA